ncbi:MAG: hypothetical protein NTY94_15555 [Alphaproteobacteria bacterium]|nr:hypothetical protein [Alphaproteobacteria bacterium]
MVQSHDWKRTQHFGRDYADGGTLYMDVERGASHLHRTHCPAGLSLVRDLADLVKAFP